MRVAHRHLDRRVPEQLLDAPEWERRASPDGWRRSDEARATLSCEGRRAGTRARADGSTLIRLLEFLVANPASYFSDEPPEDALRTRFAIGHALTSKISPSRPCCWISVPPSCSASARGSSAQPGQPAGPLEECSCSGMPKDTALFWSTLALASVRCILSDVPRLFRFGPARDLLGILRALYAHEKAKPFAPTLKLRNIERLAKELSDAIASAKWHDPDTAPYERARSRADGVAFRVGRDLVDVVDVVDTLETVLRAASHRVRGTRPKE
jgi:hypothetical protein